MKLKFPQIAMLLAGCALAGLAQAGVTNGGFETGNFTGWTQSGNTNYTYVTDLEFRV